MGSTMVRPGLRSHAKKRVARRLPGGETKVFYIRRKHYKARCAICGRLLGRIPVDPDVIRRGAKTLKRPERPYGGVICPDCLARAYRIAIRSG